MATVNLLRCLYLTGAKVDKGLSSCGSVFIWNIKIFVRCFILCWGESGSALICARMGSRGEPAACLQLCQPALLLPWVRVIHHVSTDKSKIFTFSLWVDPACLVMSAYTISEGSWLKIIGSIDIETLFSLIFLNFILQSINRKRRDCSTVIKEWWKSG